MHLNRHALRAIRERSGLSITALALRAGVSQPHLSNLERGRRQASPAVVRRLAVALAVPVVALLADPDPGPDDDSTTGPGRSDRIVPGSTSTSTIDRTTPGPVLGPDPSTTEPDAIQADPPPPAGLPRVGSAHVLHRTPVPAPPPGGEPRQQGATMSDPQLAAPTPAAAIPVIEPVARPGRAHRAALAAAGLASAAAVLAGSVPAHANTYYSGNCTVTDYNGYQRTFQSRAIASVDGATGRYIWNWYDYKYVVDPHLSFGSSSDEVVSFQSGYISGLSNPWSSPDNHGTSGDWIQESNWKGIWSDNGGTKIKFHAAFDIPGTPDPHCDVYVGTV